MTPDRMREKLHELIREDSTLEVHQGISRDGIPSLLIKRSSDEALHFTVEFGGETLYLRTDNDYFGIVWAYYEEDQEEALEIVRDAGVAYLQRRWQVVVRRSFFGRERAFLELEGVSLDVEMRHVPKRTRGVVK